MSAILPAGAFPHNERSISAVRASRGGIASVRVDAREADRRVYCADDGLLCGALGDELDRLGAQEDDMTLVAVKRLR